MNSTIPEYGVFYSYPFSHMNILATRRGSQNDDADQVPTLFFIQCSDSDVDMQHKEFLCCPIFDLTKNAGMLCHKLISWYMRFTCMNTLQGYQVSP
jgi:hypothetical protein